MKPRDLYFIRNTSVGIIKIGVARVVEERLRELMCACGMPLEVIRIVRRGEAFEKPLHLAELLAVAEGRESIERTPAKARTTLRTDASSRTLYLAKATTDQRLIAAQLEIDRLQRAAEEQRRRQENAAIEEEARIEAQRAEWRARVDALHSPSPFQSPVQNVTTAAGEVTR